MSSSQPNPPADRSHESKPLNSQGLKPIASAELFDGRQELLIQHGEDLYRLRITRNGKLILTK